MTCWRCGRVAHAPWCSDGTPNDCNHCGGNPCRWWCIESHVYDYKWGHVILTGPA